MIPLKLTIEGIYSYQSRQVIDFTQLTGAGLFGIFGAVGSGKSSILEAITYALYGETERMNRRDNRNYNMMNLRSKRSLIDFEFKNYKNEIYRVERINKRNSKQYALISSGTETWYRKQHEEWLPLEKPNVTDIVGLSYQNFKRTIIIPQGQFRAFIDLGPKDRTEMMKEIFNLQRFDLYVPTAKLWSNTNDEVNQLQGQLAAYELITPERIAERAAALASARAEKELAITQLKTAQEAYHHLISLKADFEELNEKSACFEKLQAQKEAMNALARELKEYENVKTKVGTLLESKQRNEHQLLNLKAKQHQKQADHQALQSKLKDVEAQLQYLSEQYLILPQRRQEQEDLILIFQLLQLKEEEEILSKRLEKGAACVAEAEQQADEINAALRQLIHEYNTCAASKPDTGTLFAVERWYNELEILKQKRTTLELERENILLEQQRLALALPADKNDSDIQHKSVDKQLSEIDTRIETLQMQIADLRVQATLLQHVDHLQDGEPCPLCGSLEHPKLASLTNPATKLSDAQQQLEALNQMRAALQEKKLEHQQIQERWLIIQKQLEQSTSNLNNTLQDIENHKSIFCWSNYSPEDRTAFDMAKNQLLQQEQALVKLQQDMQVRQQSLDSQNKVLERYRSAREELQLKLTEVRAAFSQSHKQLKQLRFEHYSHIPKEEVMKLYQGQKEANERVEQSYQAKKEEYNHCLTHLAVLAADINSILSQKEALQAETDQLLSTIKEQLHMLGIANIDIAQSILEKAIDIDKTRNELIAYQIEYSKLEDALSRLKTRLKDQNFDQEQLDTAKTRLEALEIEADNCSKNEAMLDGQLEHEKELMIQKQKLEKELESKSCRLRDLGILKNLFTGAGFVEYASTVYLRQLCQNANIRFHKLTRNQLSLRLNASNDFEVIDYLNEGKPRSVKTLSGGQTFQLCLCLALALAESVSANARAEQNFFFIDEGFGTQDAQSVQLVFDTLKSLQQEHRIVGIISHVDELKENIPASLTILRDEEHGSIVQPSWG